MTNPCQDKVLKDMDDQDEMKTFSSSDEESDETDEEVENERRLQRALLEKDKVSFDLSPNQTGLLNRVLLTEAPNFRVYMYTQKEILALFPSNHHW